MFSKVIPRIKEFYFLPVVFMIPAKGFIDGYEEYIKYKNDRSMSLTLHTFSCFMGAWTGALSGAFLGATWPISLPIFIGRSIDKK
jgi:hypothetical protein